MPRLLTATGFALAGTAATLLLAPAAVADSASPSAPQQVTLSAVPAPTASPTAVATPQLPAPGRTGGDIEVPAGKAEISAPGRTDDLILVALAGGGALLLAGGTVVAVSRRRQ